MNETGLTKTERADLFLDLFGNALVRQRTQDYLDQLWRELVRMVTQDKRCALSGLRDIVDVSLLKFKERDQLESIFQSWASALPFDIEKTRDNRLRYHYKDKYDFRGNMIEFDYNNYIGKTVHSSSSTRSRRRW